MPSARTQIILMQRENVSTIRVFIVAKSNERRKNKSSKQDEAEDGEREEEESRVTADRVAITQQSSN